MLLIHATLVRVWVSVSELFAELEWTWMKHKPHCVWQKQCWPHCTIRLEILAQGNEDPQYSIACVWSALQLNSHKIEINVFMACSGLIPLINSSACCSTDELLLCSKCTHAFHSARVAKLNMYMSPASTSTVDFSTTCDLVDYSNTVPF